MSDTRPSADLWSDKAPPGPTNLAAVRHRTRRVLLAEAAFPALLWPSAVIGTYALTGLLRVPQSLPDWLHGAVLAGALGLAATLAWRGLRAIRAPAPDRIDRRIEHASGLKHRPLQTLADHPAIAGGAGVWDAHLARVLAALGPLRSGRPHFDVGRHDRWRLVPALGAALIAAAIAAGSSTPSRIAAAFVPGVDDADAPLPQVQAWITPPDYAPGAPIFLDPHEGAASVPAHALLTVTTTGIAHAPHLRAATAATAHAETHALDAQSWRETTLLEQSGTLLLRSRGRTVARWTITVAPDLAPTVAWDGKPGSAKNGWRTDLPWKVTQANGVATLHAEITLQQPPKGAHSRTLSVPIPLDGHPRDAHGVSSPDLSADPWAGAAVSGRLCAESTSGRAACGPSVAFTLGQRAFHDPLAKAVLDLRRRIAMGTENRPTGADELSALGGASGPISQDSGLFLNLSSVASLLANPDVPDDHAIAEAVGRLWDLALDLEDRRHGDRASAQASLDVRAAQERVNEQLQHMRDLGPKGQSAEEQAELQRRIEALQQAIMRRMQALANRAVQDHTAVPNMQGLQNHANDALSRMMREMRDAAANGRTADAMDKLRQMEDMTERMRNATPKDLADLAQRMQNTQQAQQQAAGLQDIIRRQSSLLDHAQDRQSRESRARTRAQEQANPEGPDQNDDIQTLPTAELLRRLGLTPPPGSNADAQQGAHPDTAPGTPQSATPPDAPAGDSSLDPADRQRAETQRQQDHAVQHALGGALDELQTEFKGLLGKEPQGFKDAHGAMRDARKALSQSDDAGAVAAQQKALKDLQSGSQQMRDAMQQASQGAPSFLPGFGTNDQGGSGEEATGGEDQGGGDKPGDRDPLGRSTDQGRNGLDSDTHIPGTISREQAREIEQELRRRDSDRTRPQEELDYLDRLLKPF